MHLFIKLEIQNSQGVRRTVERAPFLCEVPILSVTDREELVAPVNLTVSTYSEGQ